MTRTLDTPEVIEANVRCQRYIRYYEKKLNEHERAFSSHEALHVAASKKIDELEATISLHEAENTALARRLDLRDKTIAKLDRTIQMQGSEIWRQRGEIINPRAPIRSPEYDAPDVAMESQLD